MDASGRTEEGRQISYGPHRFRAYENFLTLRNNDYGRVCKCIPINVIKFSLVPQGVWCKAGRRMSPVTCNRLVVILDEEEEEALDKNSGF